MSDELNPQLARLCQQYARDLAHSTPSHDLDARIDHLVAARPKIRNAAHGPLHRVATWAAAACLAVVAIAAGIVIGVRFERAREFAAADKPAERETSWPPANLTMWPTDSVALQIPAEYSPQGKLVAVDPSATRGGARYWIDVVISNDGTLRIERVVPADPVADFSGGGHDGVTLQSP